MSETDTGSALNEGRTASGALTARSSPWRPIGAFTAVAAIALLAHLCASFGLFYVYAQWTTPLLLGGVTALASGGSWKRAAMGTAAGLTLGVAVATPWFLLPVMQPSGTLVPDVIFVLLGGAAAGTMAYVLSRTARPRRTEWMAALLLLFVIAGGMWTTTWKVNSMVLNRGAVSLNQHLATPPQPESMVEDQNLYLRLFYDLHARQPYYDSYARDFAAGSRNTPLPTGVAAYRLPTIFYLWLALPPNGDAIPWAFLVFATVALASGFSIGAQLSRPGVAVLGAMIVAVAYLMMSTKTWVMFVDGWAMAVTLAGIALFVASMRRDSRRLLWASVAVMFAGAALREILVYPMLLAAASAVLLPRGKRWREVRPWLVGLACFAALYAAHAIGVAGRVSHEVGYGRYLQGGVGHLEATLQFFAPYFGGKPAFIPALTMLGLVGAITLWRRQKRLSAFLTIAVAAPLISFLFVGNGGIELNTGELMGYWGILVLPIAFALVPVAVDRVLVALGATPAAPSRS